MPCHHLRSGQYGDWRADFMGSFCGLEVQLRVGHCDLSFGQEAVGVVETLLLRQHPARGRACAPSGGPLRCRSRASGVSILVCATTNAATSLTQMLRTFSSFGSAWILSIVSCRGVHTRPGCAGRRCAHFSSFAGCVALATDLLAARKFFLVILRAKFFVTKFSASTERDPPRSCHRFFCNGAESI